MMTMRQEGYNFAVLTVSGLPATTPEVLKIPLERSLEQHQANVAKYRLLGFSEEAISYAEGIAEGCEDMLRVV
jgi:predicted ATPase